MITLSDVIYVCVCVCVRACVRACVYGISSYFQPIINIKFPSFFIKTITQS